MVCFLLRASHHLRRSHTEDAQSGITRKWTGLSGLSVSIQMQDLLHSSQRNLLPYYLYINFASENQIWLSLDTYALPPPKNSVGILMLCNNRQLKNAIKYFCLGDWKLLENDSFTSKNHSFCVTGIKFSTKAPLSFQVNGVQTKRGRIY